MIGSSGRIALAVLLLGTTGLASAQESGAPDIVASDLEQVEGAAKIRDFRKVVAQSQFVPLAESISLETLLAEHRLSLPAPDPCGQPVCIAGEAIAADLAMRPDAAFFVGISLAADTGAAVDQARDANGIVLVIDRSGSMRGWKLDAVKQGLGSILSRIGDQDRLGVVSFGQVAHVVREFSPVAGARNEIEDAIGGLKAGGETHMAAGFEMGLQQAIQEDASRVILLTDQLPNIYEGRGGSFMDLAGKAAERGIGLSFVGVDQRFDNAVAFALSSMPGGSFHEMGPSDVAEEFFAAEWAAMEGGPSGKGTITISPSAGYSISAIYGVPPELVSHAENGAVSLDVGPSFLRNRRDGIYFALSKTGGERAESTDALVRLAIAGEGPASIVGTSATPAQGLVTAQHLIDEYEVLTNALGIWHSGVDRDRAIELVAYLNARLARGEIPLLERERAMVAKLAQNMALAKDKAAPSELLGRWEVRYEKGLIGAKQGDIVEITAAGGFLIYPRHEHSEDAVTRQTYQHEGERLLIDNTDLVFNYSVKDKGRKLALDDQAGLAKLKLSKLP